MQMIKKKAMTLVEILICFAILSVVLGIIIIMLSRGATNVKRSSFNALAANQAFWIVSVIRSDISRSIGDIEAELDGENKLPANSEGSMTRETIEVIYYYIKQTAVKANYYDIYTNEKIANEEIINGHEGDQYETEEKDIDGYEIVLKDRDGNIKYPANTIGEMTKDIIEVNYYYIKKTSVTARYYDIVSGEEIADQVKEQILKVR